MGDMNIHTTWLTHMRTGPKKKIAGGLATYCSLVDNLSLHVRLSLSARRDVQYNFFFLNGERKRAVYNSKTTMHTQCSDKKGGGKTLCKQGGYSENTL